MRFAKAHGLANDFILVAQADALPEAAWPSWVPKLCDRHTGIGGDGVAFYGAAPDGGVRMRLINADGGEAEISGNGLRCLAAYAFLRGLAPARHVVHTLAGAKTVDISAAGASRYSIRTDLGEPILASHLIPTALDPPAPRVLGHRLEAAGRTVEIVSTSMGNPHCAIFSEAVADDGTVRALGSVLERHSFFPNRTNVEFVTVLSRSRIRVRFWERGVGPTAASGTGAASAAVASILSGRTDRGVQVVCDGGSLAVDWPEGGRVLQTGEAEIVFEGEWLPEA
jgi:diaminopimelate epimerase